MESFPPKISNQIESIKSNNYDGPKRKSALPDDLCDGIELDTVSVDNLNLRFLELNQEIPGIITYRLVSLETPVSLDSVRPGRSRVPLAVGV